MLTLELEQFIAFWSLSCDFQGNTSDTQVTSACQPLISERGHTWAETLVQPRVAQSLGGHGRAWGSTSRAASQAGRLVGEGQAQVPRAGRTVSRPLPSVAGSGYRLADTAARAEWGGEGGCRGGCRGLGSCPKLYALHYCHLTLGSRSRQNLVPGCCLDVSTSHWQAARGCGCVCQVLVQGVIKIYGECLN